MSKLNIYETKWLDMVFEGRNKAYGAYQLRAENSKTTIKALFAGIFLLGTAIAVPVAVNSFNHKDNDVIVCYLPITPLTPVLLPEKPLTAETQKSEAPSEPVKRIKYTGFTPVNRNQVTDDVPRNEDLNNAMISTENTDGEASTSNTSTATQPTTGNGTDDTGNNAINAPFELEAMPEYPGGMNEFINTVGKRFETPELEHVKTLKVMVFFVIEKDGSLSNIRVTRDPGYGLGKEAIRVLNSITTKWTPGYKNGQPVRTAYNLPITIQVH